MTRVAINGLGRIGKLTLWHHVARKHFSSIVANIGREVGGGLQDLAGPAVGHVLHQEALPRPRLQPQICFAIAQSSPVPGTASASTDSASRSSIALPSAWPPRNAFGVRPPARGRLPPPDPPWPFVCTRSLPYFSTA